MKNLGQYSLIFCFVLLLSTCSSRDLASFLFSESEEKELGAEFHRQLLDSAQAYPIFQTKNDTARIAFKNYITSVFDEVFEGLKKSTPKGEQLSYLNRDEFTFTIIDANIENAFAVPGGYIYIYTGIIKAMKDEAELAGVLGHELAHVQQRHYARSVWKQAAYQTLVNALLGDDAGALAQFVGGAFNILGGSYISRDHESESDEYGTTYSAATNRNPRGIATFFSRIKSSHFAIISSHPDPAKRVEAVNEQVKKSAQLQKTDTEELKYANRFMQKTYVVR